MSSVLGEEELQSYEERKRNALAQESEDVRALLATKGGRAFVWRLLGQTHFYDLSYCGENTHDTAFNEGRRAVGRWLINEVLSRHPEIDILMKREASDRDRLLKGEV